MPDHAVSADLAQRLQRLVSGWQGVDRGQTVADLHRECCDVAGGQAVQVLPARLLLVPDLDTSTLQHTLRQRGVGAELAFRVPPVGRFDAALVPNGPANETADRWLLALNAGLTPREQPALYAHALGHLLLSYACRQMGATPELDPADGRTHVDMLARLQRQEQTRTPLDQRVLEAYPLLAELLAPPQETSSSPSDERPTFSQQLASAGWRGPLVQRPYVFTEGRILSASSRRGQKERVDALLRAEASLPIAVVRTLRSGESHAVAESTLRSLACDRFCIPFAYLLDGDTIHEYDWTAGANGRSTVVSALPSRDTLLTRWLESLGLADARAREALGFPYQLSSGKPRYYQEAAINRSVIAVLQALRGLRKSRRILLTQATGTGKTKVAFQIAWKLRQTRTVNNVLFITDRDTLLSQAMDNDFLPFGDARARVRGEFVTSRSIFFATYQALAGDTQRSPMFRRYARDYFSLIIVDECHRGSAQDDSNWRRILDWFDRAIQIGLTATPLRTDNVQTYDYFDTPVATYSLRQGIIDGFLAPYKVRRVLMETERSPERPTAPAPSSNAQPLQFADGLPAAMLVEEARSALVERTEAIAEHLATYLRETDPMAKTIVFCVDQAHAERMKEALQRACADHMARYPDYVERIVADEGQDGKRALGRFQQPARHTPVVVTTSKLLSTGVDVPTCKNIVLARPVESVVEFKQIIGRGTRLHPPRKTSFTIVDYAGATRYFFDPEFDGDPEAVTIDTLVPVQPQPAPQPATAPETFVPSTTASATQPTVAGQVMPEPTPAVVDAPAGNGPARPDVDYQQGQPSTLPMNEPPPQPYAIKPDHNGTATGTENGQLGSNQPITTATAAATGMPDGRSMPLTTRLPPAAGGSSVAFAGGTGAELTERVRPSDGRRVRVVGEYVLELAPDGTTLRAVSYQEYAREALDGLCASPAELRARWLKPEQRQEIHDRLEEEGINLHELAAVLGLQDADPFDLLLHVAFGRQAQTRHQRADRVRREHADFLARYQGLAREILETVLAKYVAGEAQDVSDVGLLQVPPLSKRGTPMELAQSFPPPGGVRTALKELQELLYTA